MSMTHAGCCVGRMEWVSEGGTPRRDVPYKSDLPIRNPIAPKFELPLVGSPSCSFFLLLLLLRIFHQNIQDLKQE